PPGPSPISFINPPSPLSQHLQSIVTAALNAVDATRVTAAALRDIAIDVNRPLRVVAAGKAAAGMAAAVHDALGAHVKEGLVTAPAGPPGWRAIAASHPEPSAASDAAGREALALADRTRRDDGLLLVALSGGASAMLAVPAAGLTIEDKAATTAVLLRAG